MSNCLEAVNATLYGKECDYIKNHEKRSLYRITQVGCKCHHKFYDRGRGDLTQTHQREGGNVTMEAEPGMMGPQAKECLQPPEAEKRLVFRVWPCRHLDLKLLAFRSVKKSILLVLSHQFVVIC